MRFSSSEGPNRRPLLGALATLPTLPTLPGLLGLTATRAQTSQASATPLASWNDGPAKQAILDFVRATTDRASTGYGRSLESSVRVPCVSAEIDIAEEFRMRWGPLQRGRTWPPIGGIPDQSFNAPQ
jgi:hypothetical protein